MPITLDSTAKGADANSYASLADANAYFDTRDRVTAWSGGDDEAKKRWLIMATRDLDTIDWDRSLVGYPTSSTQRLLFPCSATLLRQYVGLGSAEPLVTAGYATTGLSDPDIVPDWLIDACCEQALAHANADRMTDADARGIKSITAGSVAVTFDGVQSSSRRRVAESVWRIIRPWARSSGDSTGATLQTADLVRV